MTWENPSPVLNYLQQPVLQSGGYHIRHYVIDVVSGPRTIMEKYNAWTKFELREKIDKKLTALTAWW